MMKKINPLSIRLHEMRLAALAIAGPLLLTVISGTAWADQVILKNGDRVTGSIVKKDGKDLIIKTDHFGTVTTQWDQVESIKTDKPIHVVLPDGKAVLGTLSTSGGKVEVATQDTKVDVAPGDIKTIRNDAEEQAYERLLKPTWLQLWSGSANLGFAGTAGNAETQTFTTAVAAARTTNTDKTSLYFNTIEASALANGKDSKTAQAVRGGVAYQHNVSKRVFASVFNDDSYDKFQNLNFRFVAGGGLGYHFIQSDRNKLDLLAGGDFNYTNFSTPLTQKTGEGYFGDDYALKISSATSLIQSLRFFDDFEDGGQYRVNFDANLATKLGKRLTWNVTLSDRYINHPAPGRKTNDFLYSTGLGVTFAK
jgi:putative salt-induced outer membrane protein YdiY